MLYRTNDLLLLVGCFVNILFLLFGKQRLENREEFMKLLNTTTHRSAEALHFHSILVTSICRGGSRARFELDLRQLEHVDLFPAE
jgi:hypothetical protein